MTEINMTQCTQPLTLIHDKVRSCLSTETGGLLDFVNPFVFDLLLGYCNIIKEPLFHNRQINEGSAEVASGEKAKLE